MAFRESIKHLFLLYFISVIFDFLIQDPDILECDDQEKKKKV